MAADAAIGTYREIRRKCQVIASYYKTRTLPRAEQIRLARPWVVMSNGYHQKVQRYKGCSKFHKAEAENLRNGGEYDHEKHVQAQLDLAEATRPDIIAADESVQLDDYIGSLYPLPSP